MGRYEKVKKQVREDRAFKKEQEKLHEKHEGVSEDTIIIEKSNMGKFMINFLQTSLRTLFGVITIGLSTIGLLTLIYPDTRTAFFDVVNQIFNDLVGLLK